MDFNPAVLLELLDQDTSHVDSELAFYRIETLKKALFKKFVPPHRASILDAEAKANFRKLNEEVSHFDVEYSSFMGRWRSRLADDLSESDGSSVLRHGLTIQHGYCGPGSSVGANGDDFYTKLFCSPLSTTSRFLDMHFRNSVPEHWKQAISASPFDSVLVPGSRISTVPKDESRNRTICVEPILNMYYQLGAKQILERVLVDRYGISVSTQPDKNKELAKLGSIDGRLATIDLKNASDMISQSLVKFLLPKHAYSVLDEYRCKATWVDNDLVPLSMFSTMGNGFTFPLMTLLFCSMLRVVYEDLQLPFNKNTFGVFGDDIICLSEAYETVVSRIQEAGFIVNLDKSFNAGFFRESCGGDFYHGHDVRGVYIKGASNEAAIYSVFNRLMRWSIANGISIHRTLSYVKGLAVFRPVPRHAGFHEGFIIDRSNLLCPKTDRNGSILYRATETVRRQFRINDDTTNPLGALVSALGGYVVDNQVTLRSHLTKWRVVKKRTPCWDFSYDSVFNTRELGDTWNQLLS